MPVHILSRTSALDMHGASTRKRGGRGFPRASLT